MNTRRDYNGVDTYRKQTDYGGRKTNTNMENTFGVQQESGGTD